MKIFGYIRRSSSERNKSNYSIESPNSQANNERKLFFCKYFIEKKPYMMYNIFVCLYPYFDFF